jgi:hypothetical protein
MPRKTVFTAEELAGYFSGELQSVHADAARAAEEAMRVHADGLYPKAMIEQRRPNEPADVQEYREIVYKPKTKPFFAKILNSLSKIRRSSDWSVQYPDEEFTKIPETETLEEYCEKKFPFHKSVTNWTFSVLLREWAIDPNAVLLVKPLDPVTDPTQFLRPFPMVFNSTWVLEHREENYSVLENPIGAVYYVEGVAKVGRSFYVVTTESVMRYDQVNDKPEFNLMEDYLHGLGYLPAYKLGGVLISQVEDDFLYQSRLDGILPEFDEALREYSDLQASKVMHIYLERYEVTGNECPTCNGLGTLPGLTPDSIGPVCGTCKGQKYLGAGPYEKLLIPIGGLQAASGQSIPMPPIGYVQKEVDIVRIQQEGVDAHIREGLGAINMEHLADVPLAQSGIAKEVDRDETNNFAHSVGEDLVRVMDWLYRCIAKYRYGVQYPSDDDIQAMLPNIPVPEHFDIFSTKYLEEELKNAKDNKLNPIIVSAMELSYASKKFSSDPEVRDRLTLILELDPMPNVSEDEKQARLTNKGVRMIDYVISSNIQYFVQRAIIEDENFPMLDYEIQRKKMEEYAQEVIDENDTAAQLKSEVLNGESNQSQPAGQAGAVPGQEGNGNTGTGNENSQPGSGTQGAGQQGGSESGTAVG